MGLHEVGEAVGDPAIPRADNGDPAMILALLAADDPGPAPGHVIGEEQAALRPRPQRPCSRAAGDILQGCSGFWTAATRWHPHHPNDLPSAPRAADRRESPRAARYHSGAPAPSSSSWGTGRSPPRAQKPASISCAAIGGSASYAKGRLGDERPLALPRPNKNATTRDITAMARITSSDVQGHCKDIQPVLQKKLTIPGVSCVPTQPS